MAPVIGQAIGKWFGSRVIGPTTAGSGFTAITSAANIAATTTGIAITTDMMIGTMIGVMIGMTTIATTVNKER
jgi:hypothetical protein